MPTEQITGGRWTERFPIARLPWFANLAAAVLATATGTALRMLLDPQLPPGFPFLTYFPVVIATAFVLGWRAGAMTAILAGLSAWYWFLPPFGSFGTNHNVGVALLFYVFITGTEVVLVHWMQTSNRSLLIEREANGRLAETRELLFRELQHRISNNLQVVAALLSLQKRQITDERARGALDEAARRLGLVGKISRQLYDSQGQGRDLALFLDQLTRDVIEASGRSDIAHEVSGSNCARVSPNAAVPLALVVAEAVANAIEHGFAEGQSDCRLDIRLLSAADHRLTVEIADNGTGLPVGFSLQSSDSLGLKIATMLATQLGGTYTLVPGAVSGARARLELPMLPA